MANMDADFAAFAKEVHGIDPEAGPMPLPTLSSTAKLRYAPIKRNAARKRLNSA